MDYAGISGLARSGCVAVIKGDAIIATPTAISANTASIPTKAKPMPAMTSEAVNKTVLDTAVVIILIRLVIWVSPVSSCVSMI